MWVCLCKAVTSSAIDEVIDNGARSVVEVGRVCGAGTDCTQCTRTIVSMLRQRRQERHDDHRRLWWVSNGDD